MKIRLAMMAAFSVLLLAGALLWLMDHKISEERRTALEIQLRGSVSALNRSVQAEVKGLRRTLAQTPSLARERMNWSAFQPFFAFAQLRYRGNSLEVIQFAADPKSRAREWRAEDLQKMLLAFQKNPAPPQGASLKVLSFDPQRPLLALFWQDGERSWLALSGPEFLQAFLDLQKDGESTLAIMNAAGEILAHSTSEYVGTKVSQGSLYADVLSAPDLRSYRQHVQGVEGGPAWAASERLPRSDVTSLAFQSTKVLSAARAETLLFGLLATFGLMIVTTSSLWWMAARAERALLANSRTSSSGKTVNPVAQHLPTPTAGLKKASTPTASSASMGDLPLRLASALGHELKSPLVSILGYCQMILASHPDSRIKEPTESILREARACRAVLDKLLAFAGEKESPQKSSRVDALVLKGLKEFQDRLKRKHVKVVQEIKETAPVPLMEDEFEKAFHHIIDNAIEAMDRMSKKEIKIRIFEDSEFVRVEVQDTGEGIEESRIEQVLTPFYTTRGAPQHLGLGLPAAAGILREHGGDLKIQSKRGEGTKVVLSLPRTAKKVQIGDQNITLKVEENIQIPKEIPRAALKPGTKDITPLSVEPLVLMDQTSVREGASVPSETQYEGTRSSPPDLDLDQLFSMPDATVVRTPENKVPDASTSRPLVPRGRNSAPGTAVTTPSVRDDRTVVIPVQATVLTPADEKINLPSFKVPEKKSALDEVRVSIRRPGTRLE